MSTVLGWAALIACFLMEAVLVYLSIRRGPGQSGAEMTFWLMGMGVFAVLFIGLMDLLPMVEVPWDAIPVLGIPLLVQDWRTRTKRHEEARPGTSTKWTVWDTGVWLMLLVMVGGVFLLDRLK